LISAFWEYFQYIIMIMSLLCAKRCDRMFYVLVFEKGHCCLQCTLKLIRINAVMYSDISFKILILILESDTHVKLESARGVSLLIIIHCGLSGRWRLRRYAVFFQDYINIKDMRFTRIYKIYILFFKNIWETYKTYRNNEVLSTVCFLADPT